MKKYLFIYMCMMAMGTTCFTSCNEAEFLNLDDPSHLTEKKFWKSKADAESALAAAYSPIKGQMYGYYGAFDGWLNLNGRGDDIFTVPNEEINMYNIATFQNTVTTGNTPFGDLYSGIQRANVVIKYVDQMEDRIISKSDKMMIKGEAMFLRAYQYFLLVNNYKEVPLRLLPSNEEAADKEPASEAQLWKQVEDDLLYILKECNLPVNRPSTQKGRIEKGAVVFLLGKVYATQHKYLEAKEQLGQLLKSPYTYDLVDDYASNFVNTSEFNKESIWELQYSSDGQESWWNEVGVSLGSSIPQFIGPVASGGWAKLMPTAFIVDAFGKELRPNDSDTKFDKRMYASFFFNPQEFGDVVKNEKWYGNNFSLDELWEKNAGKMTSDDTPKFTFQGKQNCKFILKKYTAYYVKDKAADNMANKQGKANNVRIMRFAEALLLYAEACAKTNDVAGANEALKRIRNRAGLADKTFTTEELMPQIEHQCLLEFFGEGHRFDDLKRWYSAEEMKQIFINNGKIGGERFEEKFKYYPIPMGELNNNRAMKQIDLWK